MSWCSSTTRWASSCDNSCSTSSTTSYIAVPPVLPVGIRPSCPVRGQNGRMQLPVMPPVPPMLAKAVKQIPDGDVSFEPKWDGFRSIVFRDGDEVEIGSRNEKPMTRYFPELVEAIRVNLPERCVIDGEIVVIGASGDRLDFQVLH